MSVHTDLLERNVAVLPEGDRRRLSAPTADSPLSVDTASGQLVLTTADGRRVRLHSARSPEREADAVIDHALQGSAIPHVAIVIGAGHGHVVDRLEARSPATTVVVLEPFAPAARAFLSRRDWSARLASGSLHVLVGPDYAASPAAVRCLTDAERPLLLTHPVLVRERAEDLRSARAALDRLRFESGANAEAERQFAGPYLANTLANLRTIAEHRDVADLFGRFAGTPAIVIAAGPSLDANVRWLRRVRERAVFIAVDTALRPLADRGLEPDVVVAVDPSETNARHFAHVRPLSRAWLVAEGSIHPSCFAPFGGRICTFRVGDNQPWPSLRAQGVDRGTLTVWGSVLTAACDLAIRMGCGSIVFAGADLGFSGGQPYCRGTAYEADWTRGLLSGRTLDQMWSWYVTPAALDVEDVAGGLTKTTPALKAFRDWLVDASRRMPQVSFVNATGAGILSGGAIRQVDGDEAERLLAALPPSSIRTPNEELTPGPGGTPAGPGDGSLMAAAAVLERVVARDRLVAAPLAADQRALLGSLPPWRLFEWTEEARPEVARLERTMRAVLLALPEPSPAPEPPAPRRRVPPTSPIVDDQSGDVQTIKGVDLRQQDLARLSLHREWLLAAQGDPPAAGRTGREGWRLLEAAVGREVRALLDANAETERRAGARIVHVDLGRETVAIGPFASSLSELSRTLTGLLRRGGSRPLGAPAERFFTTPVHFHAPVSLLVRGAPPAVMGSSAGPSTALFAVFESPDAIAIAADGGWRLTRPWPKCIRGVRVVDPRGATVAWHPDGQYVMSRSHETADVDVQDVTFRPTSCYVDDGGEVWWTGKFGGVWRGRPGQVTGPVVETPPLLSIHRADDARLSLDPLTRHPDGAPVRRRLTQGFAYRPASGVLAVSDLPPLGQRGFSSQGAGWTATPHPFADIVRLSANSGEIVDLLCYYPMTAAWAGRSLIVATGAAELLLFEDLADTLSAPVGEGLTS